MGLVGVMCGCVWRGRIACSTSCDMTEGMRVLG